MSLLSVLKAVGKDLSHVAGWVEDGLKIAAPVVGVIDPPLGAILTEVEEILSGLSVTKSSITLNAQGLQALMTAVSTVHGVKASIVSGLPIASP